MFTDVMNEGGQPEPEFSLHLIGGVYFQGCKGSSNRWVTWLSNRTGRRVRSVVNSGQIPLDVCRDELLKALEGQGDKLRSQLTETEKLAQALRDVKDLNQGAPWLKPG